jgi:hypothetical protein
MSHDACLVLIGFVVGSLTALAVTGWVLRLFSFEPNTVCRECSGPAYCAECDDRCSGLSV